MSRSNVGRAASTYVLAAAVQKAAPFLLLLVLARTVSVDTFGKVSILTAIFVLTTAFGGLGLEAAAFRGVFSAGSKKGQEDYYAALAKISVLGPVLLAMIAAVLIWQLSDAPLGIDAGDVIMSVGGGALLAAATTLPLAKLRAEDAVGLYVLCTLTPTGVQVVAKIVLVLGLDLGATGWAVGDLVAGTAALMLTARYQWRFLRKWPVEHGLTTRVLGVGLPLLPHTLSSWVLSLSDRLVVAAFVGVGAAGQYALASQLASVGMILSSELNRAVAPEFGRAIGGDSVTVSRLTRVVRMQRVSAIVICVATAAVGTVFLLKLAPTEYRVGIQWLVILSAAYMIYAWYYAPMNALSITQGRTALMPLITGASAAVNVGLNLLFVRQYGAVVCAYTTLLGYAILFMATSVYAGRQPFLAWRWGELLLCGGATLALVGLGSVF